VAGNFHLLPCSPAIDAGDNQIVNLLKIGQDLGKNIRVQENKVDLGVFETPGLSLASAPIGEGTCLGTATGRVRLDIVNGCAPFQFAWTNGGNMMGVDTIHLAPGQYNYTITDAHGHQLSTTVTVPGSKPSVIISGDTAVCAGTASGLLNAVVTSAAPPVSYEWSNGSTSQSVANILPGAIDVTITDGYGCADSTSVKIAEVPYPTVHAQVVNASGAQKSDGSIQVNVIQGLGPFSFFWPATGDTVSNLANLPAGLYELVLTDGMGCKYVFVYEVGVTSATEEASSGYQFSISPNPATDFIDIIAPGFDRFRLYNTAGQLVLDIKGSLDSNHADVSQLPAGVYYFSISRIDPISKAGKIILVH
jgi:hypothetical protein